MRLQKPEISIATSEDFQELSFGIKDADMGIILEILRNKMYQHPIAAICREVSSNARDANREVGNAKKPIDILFQETPFLTSDICLVIQDAGPGISPERMADVFINYGASTKRTTNKLTGGFGLGAKTPFSYTDTFSIVTVVDGKKYTYTAAIENQSKGCLYCSPPSETNDPNGTSIIIPIKEEDQSSFEKEIFRSTIFWDVQPNYQNFKSSAPDFKTMYRSKFGRVIQEKSRYSFFSRSYNMLIDGIVYSIDSNNIDFAYRNVPSNICLFLEFKTGELTIAANREAVQYDDKTKLKINERFKEISSEITTYLEDEIENSESYIDACRKYAEMHNEYTGKYYAMYSILYTHPEFSYQGKKVRSSHGLSSLKFIKITNSHGELSKNPISFWPEKDQKVFFLDKSCLSGGRNRTLFKQDGSFTIVEPTDKEFLKWNDLPYSQKKAKVKKFISIRNELKYIQTNGLQINPYSSVPITKIERTPGVSSYKESTRIFAKTVNLNERSYNIWGKWKSVEIYREPDGSILYHSEELDSEKQCYCVVPTLSDYDKLSSFDEEYTLAKILYQLTKIKTFFINERSKKYFEDLLPTLEDVKDKIFTSHKLKLIKSSEIFNSFELKEQFITFKTFFQEKEIQKIRLLEKYAKFFRKLHLPTIPSKFLEEVSGDRRILDLKDTIEGIKNKYSLLLHLNYYYSEKDKIKQSVKTYIEAINAIHPSKGEENGN